MSKIIVLVAFVSLVAKSREGSAQITTHYRGIANAHFIESTFPPDCGPYDIRTEVDSLQYTVIHRNNLPDSISYTIINTHFPIPMTNSMVPSDTFYIKKDQDSIVFPFSFNNVYTYQGDFGTDCAPTYLTTIQSHGIARISTATAGVSFQENEAPVEFFPNPTSGLLNIKTKASKATVADNLGRVLIIQSLDVTGLNTLDVSSLPAGSYLLLLSDGAKKTFGRFIKY